MRGFLFVLLPSMLILRSTLALTCNHVWVTRYRSSTDRGKMSEAEISCPEPQQPTEQDLQIDCDGVL